MKAKLLLMVMIISVVFCVCAFSEESLPIEIIRDLQGMEMISSAPAVLPDGKCWFVLASKTDGITTLKYYILKDDQYFLQFESDQCIPQVSDELFIDVDFEFEDFTTHNQYKLPVLTISQWNEKDGYLEWLIGYQYEDIDTWRLVRIWNYTEYGNIMIKDGWIQVYEDVEADHLFLSQPLEYNLNLNTIDYSSFLSYINTIVESQIESIEYPEDLHG